MARVTYSVNQKRLIAEIATSEAVLKREIDPVFKEFYFDPAVEQLKADFEASSVTQEIAGGVDSSNISNTLEGPFREDGQTDSPPNLWGFIGFDSGEGSPGEVLGKIRARLDSRHPDGPKMRYIGRDKGKLIYRYEIIAPNSQAIEDATPIPWLPGISWARRIEQGLSGINHFLNVRDRPSSRSGGGIQVEGNIRSGRYKPTPYLSKMFNNFLKTGSSTEYSIGAPCSRYYYSAIGIIDMNTTGAG